MIRQVNNIGAPAGAVETGAAARSGASLDFLRVFQGALRPEEPLRFSAHASQRLRERNIVLGDTDVRRISAAADKLASKGGRDALVVMDSVGLILDVRNRTVVTAVDRQGLQDNVFTNIDSAVFA